MPSPRQHARFHGAGPGKATRCCAAALAHARIPDPAAPAAASCRDSRGIPRFLLWLRLRAELQRLAGILHQRQQRTAFSCRAFRRSRRAPVSVPASVPAPGASAQQRLVASRRGRRPACRDTSMPAARARSRRSVSASDAARRASAASARRRSGRCRQSELQAAVVAESAEAHAAALIGVDRQPCCNGRRRRRRKSLLVASDLGSR